MSTTKASRELLVREIRRRVALRLAAIDAVVAAQPDEMDLGTWKGIDNRVGRTLHDVEDYARRARARREARDGR